MTLYFTAGTRRAAVALDAATGELQWIHTKTKATAARRLPDSCRDAASPTGPTAERRESFTSHPATSSSRSTPRPAMPHPQVRRRGVVDLKLDDDQEIDLGQGRGRFPCHTLSSRTNVVIVGAAHPTGANLRKAIRAVKGYVRGFDVKDRQTPLDLPYHSGGGSEFGNDSWEKNSNSYTGNAGVWAQISVDEELGLWYLPIELPTGDYFGCQSSRRWTFWREPRRSLIFKPGKRKWHFQLVHHGIWDMDIPCAPILVDITVEWHCTIKAVALNRPSKAALYVFNCATESIRSG